MAAKKKKTAKKASKKTAAKKPNASDLIRGHLEKHPAAKNKEIIGSLANKGVEVSSPQVSIVAKKWREKSSAGIPAETEPVAKNSKFFKEFANLESIVNSTKVEDDFRQAIAGAYADGYAAGLRARK